MQNNFIILLPNKIIQCLAIEKTKDEIIFSTPYDERQYKWQPLIHKKTFHSELSLDERIDSLLGYNEKVEKEMKRIKEIENDYKMEYKLEYEKEMKRIKEIENDYEMEYKLEYEKALDSMFRHLQDCIKKGHMLFDLRGGNYDNE